MVPDSFANYFVASAGAGAALIGLLFVAISINPERTFGDSAHPVRRGVASAAFTALTNAFFVSLSALIPLANVGVVVLIVSAADVVFTLRLGRTLLRDMPQQRRAWRAWVGETGVFAMLGLSLLLYGYECAIGIGLLLHPRDVGFAAGLAEILLGVYAVGLARAWELLGGPRGGLFRWLNPLQEQAQAAPSRAPSPSDAELPATAAPVQPSPRASAPVPTSAPLPAAASATAPAPAHAPAAAPNRAPSSPATQDHRPPARKPNDG